MEKLGSRHQNLDRKVYTVVKAMILDRKLEPGTKILQDKLAHELGVSRTPLVNALKMLEHEKLIISKPRRGFFVRLFSKQEMIHIFELREVLEGLAARRAALYGSAEQTQHLQDIFEHLETSMATGNLKKYAEVDRQFHNFLVEIGGKEFLSSILQTYNIITFSYQYLKQEGLVRPPGETLSEHSAIVEAITSHDSVKAEAMTRQHLSKSRERLVEEDDNDITEG